MNPPFPRGVHSPGMRAPTPGRPPRNITFHLEWAGGCNKEKEAGGSGQHNPRRQEMDTWGG